MLTLIDSLSALFVEVMHSSIKLLRFVLGLTALIAFSSKSLFKLLSAKIAIISSAYVAAGKTITPHNVMIFQLGVE